MRKYEYITSDAGIAELIPVLEARDRIAVDFEGEFNLHIYGEHLCLVQIFDGEDYHIIDPRSSGVSPKGLGMFFQSSVQKIFFDAQSDASLVHKRYGMTIRNIYDIRIPAMLLGYAGNLLGLEELYLGIDNTGGKKKKQTSNWLVRPLGDEQIEYALSDVEFLREKWISRPIPTTTALETFMKEPVEQRWVYYCGTWENGVPNRQFGMPSARNRVLGVLLYLYDLDGFLNWGYNFWFTQHSLNWHIDPYQVVDAGRAFCGGGALGATTCQILADILQRDILVVESPQNVGAVGAAACIAVGMGIIPTMKDVKKLIPVDKIYHPNKAVKAVYDKNFKVYQNLYKCNKENFAILNG